MRLRWMWALLLCGSALCGAAAQEWNATAAMQAVDAAHARGDFDGVVVISQHGKVLMTKAVGMADRAKRTPLRTASVFRLASLTKQVTALLVMQQVAAGKLRLDEPAAEVFPGLSATAGRVTVGQLLQHISGLPNPSTGPEDVVPPFYLRRDVNTKYLRETATGFCSGTPVRPPDEKFEYNNCDYIVLGAMLEQVTGMPYAQLVAAKITRPLGLKSWGIFNGDGATPKTVASYGADGKVDLPQNPATYGSAGALYGNALDVAKWNNALLNHTLLDEAATAQMFHGERNLGGEALGSWSYDLPGTAPAVHLVERQGDIGATRLLNLLLPAQDGSIVILANTERADLFNTYSQKGLGFAIVKALTKQ